MRTVEECLALCVLDRLLLKVASDLVADGPHNGLAGGNAHEAESSQEKSV